MTTEATQKTIVEQIAAKRKAFSLREFSEIIGMSYRSLNDMANNRTLPCIRIGTTIRLDPKTTADWLRERTTGGAK